MTGFAPTLMAALRLRAGWWEHQPLPADPPIGGPIWTIVIPALLLFGSFLGTYLLYRRFSKEESK